MKTKNPQIDLSYSVSGKMIEMETSGQLMIGDRPKYKSGTRKRTIKSSKEEPMVAKVSENIKETVRKIKDAVLSV